MLRTMNLRIKGNLDDRIPATFGFQDASQLEARIRRTYNFPPFRLTSLWVFSI